jgi:hypothetical protein
MSVVVVVDRDVMAVSADAIASRFFHPVAHLTGKQLVPFLGLLAACHVQKDAEHGSV